jgi:hypothetical protein
MNDDSKSCMQLEGQLALYKNYARRSNFVIANSAGAGTTIGKTTFYQSLFLGGQGNLL